MFPIKLFLLVALVGAVTPLKFKFLARSSAEVDQVAAPLQASVGLDSSSNFTVCTFVTGGDFADLQATSGRFGVHLNVVNLSTKQLSSHQGLFNKKLRAILAVASTLPSDSVMLALDAFDVLIGRPAGDMESEAVVLLVCD